RWPAPGGWPPPPNPRRGTGRPPSIPRPGARRSGGACAPRGGPPPPRAGGGRPRSPRSASRAWRGGGGFSPARGPTPPPPAPTPPPLRVPLAELLSQDAEAGEGIEQVQVTARAQEGLRLMLAVDLDQRLAQLLGHRQGGVRVVEEDPSAAAPDQLAAHDELAVVRVEAVRLEESGDRALLGQGEHRLDRGGVGAGADGLGRLGPLAEEQREGVDRDRLAGARLSGQDVEAGPEGNRDGIEDREVPDSQLFQHRLSLPPSRGLLNVRP